MVTKIEVNLFCRELDSINDQHPKIKSATGLPFMLSFIDANISLKE
jgi:hypothetical protein